jgi:hypothetical protein
VYAFAVNPILVPLETDWIVCIWHAGGLCSKFRVSPGTLEEEEAARRAIAIARIDISTVSEIRVLRASEHVRVEHGDYEAQLRALLKKGKSA